MEIRIQNQQIMKGWLILATSAIAVGGIFSILLVLSRTPFFQAIIPFKDFFHTALIVHVNLSVLVWSLSIGAILWASISDNIIPFIGKTAIGVAATGAILITLSAFMSDANPLLNNYIPVLQTALFFLGLSLFASGIILQMLDMFLSIKKDKSFEIISTGIISLTALLCFIAASKSLTFVEGDSLETYYESLFWGGGHILQFVYTQIMLICWMVLGRKNDNKLFFLFGVILCLPTPLIYYFYDAGSPEIYNFFTKHMIYLGGIAPVICLFIILSSLFRTPINHNLIASIILFFTGGVLGLMISGADVTIPAHYHGSIVGYTLAFMGLVYYLLPKLGFGEINQKLAIIQPWLYGTGQFMHIIGLAWSGGYGAIRKTPGAELAIQAKIGMGLMGAGGLIAIIGGLLFVVIVFRAIFQPKSS